jgi:hypothetical protein
MERDDFCGGSRRARRVKVRILERREVMRILESEACQTSGFWRRRGGRVSILESKALRGRDFGKG